MYIGFDYGTANCAAAIMKNGKPILLPIDNNQPYIASSLAAPTREAVSESLFRHHNIQPSDETGHSVLRRAIQANRLEDIDVEKDSVQFGQAALNLYLSDPEETYFVKSPKSFLGSSGLQDVQISFFEDLVCSMMLNVKQKSEQQIQADITQTVIGRPINFQGVNEGEANQQAERILRNAATRAGFKDIAFQYEPVAAGIEFESQLTRDKLVLVVDIGGGTTDCSMITMGPTWVNSEDRSASLLAHSGCRVGGNDLDIALAYQQIMPLFGKDLISKQGLAMPIVQFWNPVAINNVAAQNDFYAKSNLKVLKELQRTVNEPALFDRLAYLHEYKLGHHVVRQAEQLKITLSDETTATSPFELDDETLMAFCDQNAFCEAIEVSTGKIVALIDEAVTQAGKKPDMIFVTGGSARSPQLRQRIQAQLPNTEIVAGDFFGSVTAGLARWAETCFR